MLLTTIPGSVEAVYEGLAPWILLTLAVPVATFMLGNVARRALSPRLGGLIVGMLAVAGAILVAPTTASELQSNPPLGSIGNALGSASWDVVAPMALEERSPSDLWFDAGRLLAAMTLAAPVLGALLPPGVRRHRRETSSMASG